MVLLGDLPMLGLAALTGFGTTGGWVRTGVAVFALAASGAHLLMTLVQVFAQARPLFYVTATAQKRIGFCKYSL